MTRWSQIPEKRMMELMSTTDRPTRITPGRWRMRYLALLVGVGCMTALLAVGCRSEDSPGDPADAANDMVPPVTAQPEYAFAHGLDDAYPEVVSFLRHLLETCLAGDYRGYRQLVSRGVDPESRARFEKVLESLQRLDVESITEVDLPRVPPPAYYVVSRVKLRPESESILRRRDNDRVAILVFEEEGELRMAIAPPDLQPARDEPPASQPTTTSAPSYPWDENVDY